MRVLICHSVYGSGSASGENRVVEDEISLLRLASHDVRTLKPGFEVARGIGLVHAGMSAIWSRAAVADLVDAIHTFAPHVVHFHNLFPSLSPAVIRAAARGDTAVVLTLHNFRLMCLPGTLMRNGNVCELCVARPPLSGIRHRCYRGSRLGSGVIAASLMLHRTMNTFDHVSLFLAVSQFLRSKHIEHGIPPKRIRVKPSFSWPQTSRSGPGDYFLYLGRLSAEKGVDTIVQAWKVAQIQTRLIVAGNGPDSEILQRAAPPTVEFVGLVSPEEAARLMSHARAVLVPSRWYEGSPRSVVEAYACGVPVLASEIGGLPELVDDNVSGMLLPPTKPESWAHAVRLLLDDRESERLGGGAKELWQQFYSPEVALVALEESYEEAQAAV